MKQTIWLFVLSGLISPHFVWAWGKNGHAIVGSTAALVLADQASSPFLRSHSYDMGFYNNVPDLVWKASPKIYKQEWYNHFLDLEIFQRKMKKQNKWLLNRIEFEKKFPSIEKKAGRAFWRIDELYEELSKVTSNLQALKKKDKNYQKKQVQWLLLAGVMGHYVADLAQPLHCTENYDGQKTGQKGIHAFFEETVVDALMSELTVAVSKQAQKAWKSFHKKHSKKKVFDLMRELCEDSYSHLGDLFKTDKKTGRKKIEKAQRAHQKMITQRLVKGSLYLAEIWSRQLGWDYYGKKFYIFYTNPDFIAPPSGQNKSK